MGAIEEQEEESKPIELEDSVRWEQTTKGIEGLQRLRGGPLDASIS